MGELKRSKEEYGGFLPLELNPGTEYFAEYENVLCRFNTVKAALDFLIRQLGLKNIYIPYYYCPSTIEAIRKTGIDVLFYHIDENLMPLYLPDNSGTIVLLVDYFGVCSRKIEKFARSFCHAEVIIDRAHAFYEKPVMDEHIYNVYSAKKFFGVPDGAYLIGKTVLSSQEIPVEAHNYTEYLITAYEEGTNAAYAMKKEVDEMLAVNYGCISKLSLGVLKNVDYDRIRKRRLDNYETLSEAFEKVNELILPKKCPAYQFPLLISDAGREIKKALIADKIFVSTLWSGKDLKENGNAFEINMMNNAIFLPMDQRYDYEDMRYIAGKVKDIEDKFRKTSEYCDRYNENCCSDTDCFTSLSAGNRS